MLNLICELGQIVFLGALAYGAFLCLKESELFRALAEHMQPAEGQEVPKPANRELVRAMMPRITGV